MRRVLVTAASTPLGQRVVNRLSGRADVESVAGVDRPTGVADLVETEAIDTIVHCGMCPSRTGARTEERADMITTLGVAAAASTRRGPVRTVIAVSSTEAYRASSRSPTWRREDERLDPPRDTDAALVLEAEACLRDVAERHPHISVGILRLADLAGPAIWGGLASLLAGAVVPFVAGYDPPVQFLHVDDAVRGIEHTASRELAGTFNLTGDGIVHWRRAARLVGRYAVPVVPRGDALEPLMRALRLPLVPASLVDVLRFGRCADGAALAATGFTPDHSTEWSLRSMADRRSA